MVPRVMVSQMASLHLWLARFMLIISTDTEAINKAITDGGQCRNGCGLTTTLGAVIFFPAGTYMVSSLIIQYYYTKFIGNPTASSRPTIKGLPSF